MTEKMTNDNDRGEVDSRKTMLIEKESLVQTFKGFGTSGWISTWKIVEQTEKEAYLIGNQLSNYWVVNLVINI